MTYYYDTCPEQDDEVVFDAPSIEAEDDESAVAQLLVSVPTVAIIYIETDDGFKTVWER